MPQQPPPKTRMRGKSSPPENEKRKAEQKVRKSALKVKASEKSAKSEKGKLDEKLRREAAEAKKAHAAALQLEKQRQRRKVRKQR